MGWPRGICGCRLSMSMTQCEQDAERKSTAGPSKPSTIIHVGWKTMEQRAKSKNTHNERRLNSCRTYPGKHTPYCLHKLYAVTLNVCLRMVPLKKSCICLGGTITHIHTLRRMCFSNPTYSFKSLQVTLCFVNTWTWHFHYSSFYFILSQWDHRLSLFLFPGLTDWQLYGKNRGSFLSSLCLAWTVCVCVCGLS